MQRIRVAAAVLNQTPMDWATNLANIRQAIQLAREENADLLCLPELCLTGYGCEDMFLAPGVWRTAWTKLQELLPETRGLAVVLGLPVYIDNGVFNTACLVVDGKIAGFVAKQHLAGDGLHYEPRWFRAWPSGVVSEITLDGHQYPIGDIVFSVGGVRMGFEICEDAWVASRPGAGMAARGVDMILNPSASHFAFGKHEVRKRFVLEGSRAFGVAYVYANLLGNESGRTIYDGGALIASSAELIATGPRFSYADAVVTAATVNLDVNRTARAKTFAMRSEHVGQDDSSVVQVAFDWGTPGLESSNKSVRLSNTGDIETAEDALGVASKEEEFTHAVSLGLFDYLRKSRSNGFVISMSGGADSSAVGCLIRTLADLSIAEIGVEGVVRKLRHIAAINEAGNGLDSADSLMQKLFLGVYQATKNSSNTTLEAARELTSGLGGEFVSLDVDPMVSLYRKSVEGAIGRELNWDKDDIALQNIQARTRGPGVWMLANLRNALLLATSNRSEAAVGYATMDGDTCGGLSPIAGIDKAFLRHWLRWMETDGPRSGSAVPVLKLVNCQQPTAELRPLEASQTDETDLMPYPVLDAIETAAIRDKMMPDAVFVEMSSQFPNYSSEQIKEWITKFFRLWSRNQWKRERYAPSFHVDDANLDPKTWCRFPILSGGYAEELANF